MIPAWVGLTAVSALLAASVSGWLLGFTQVPRLFLYGSFLLPTDRIARFVGSFMDAVEPGGNGGGN